MSLFKTKRAKRATTTVGVLGLSLTGLYLYQPQRIDFFPRSAPVPNPQVDPDRSILYAKGTRVAVISAHPDDTEFYIGGTLTKLGQSGAKILLIVCTDGDKGYYPWFMTNPAENRRVRRQEQIDAAKHYGGEVVFLARPDGRLRSDAELIQAIHDKLREFEPEYVLAFDPIYPPKIQHSDHLQSGIAAGYAVQGIDSIRWLLRYSTHAANYYDDITSEWPTKEKLLAIHKSQFGDPDRPREGAAGAKLNRIDDMLRSRAQQDGRAIGVDLAEGFRVEKPASQTE